MVGDFVVKAGASCQSFTEMMSFETFKLVGILGGEGEGGKREGGKGEGGDWGGGG